ncbi:MAG: methyltransferase domain-containing protein [Myxococcota bacterium]
MRDPDWPEPDTWPSDAARDRLIGDWALWQRTGGHRTSTDDVLTAWFASSRFERRPDHYLDLGCGVGSVLLMVAYRLRPGEALGVEAQAQSVLLARRTLSELPPDAPAIEIRHADFRGFELPPDAPRYDLITGSPPYFPLGTGSLPDDAQRRACRFEARGGVEAYCETAARLLSAGGRFVFVFQTEWDERALAAVDTAGLHVHARVDAKMREDRVGPFLTVYEVGHTVPERAVVRSELAIRTVDGAITPRYLQARQQLGVAEAPVSPAGAPDP